MLERTKHILNCRPVVGNILVLTLPLKDSSSAVVSRNDSLINDEGILTKRYYSPLSWYLLHIMLSPHININTKVVEIEKFLTVFHNVSAKFYLAYPLMQHLTNNLLMDYFSTTFRASIYCQNMYTYKYVYFVADFLHKVVYIRERT